MSRKRIDPPIRCEHSFRVLDMDGVYALREMGADSIGLRGVCVTCKECVRIVIPRKEIRAVSDQIAHFAP